MSTKTCKYCFEVFERKHYGCVCSACEKPKRSKMAESEICLVALDRIFEPGRRAKIEDALRKYRSREDAISQRSRKFHKVYRMKKTTKVNQLGDAVYERQFSHYRCKKCNAPLSEPKCLECDLKEREVE